MRKPTIWTFLVLSAFFAGAEENTRGVLFGAADEARARAVQANAALLAPLSFGAGKSDYERAEKTLARGGSVEAIRKQLAKAQADFEQAAKAAEVAAATLTEAIRARQDAQRADAPGYAKFTWEEANVTFNSAVERLERGSIKNATRFAAEAEDEFREAELEAIKANYLNETKALLDEARAERAHRFAPVSFQNATRLLEDAEKELNSNRYDTDRPRNIAMDAKHNAHHAIYVAKLWDRMDRRKISLEEVLLGWEASLRELAAVVDTPIYFDAGERAAIAKLIEVVRALQADRERSRNELDDTVAQLTALQGEVSLMRQRLGGDNETIAELSLLLERQARNRDRMATIEAMFERDEAQVLREGDHVIIRMIGLNFDFGRSELKSEHRGLLRTLENAIAEFPESHVVVEGHTDSFGSDSQNLTLSQSRADALVRHLLTNTPISPANVTAFGYGEARPVANNETPEGRQRNRRIDVVIQPL